MSTALEPFAGAIGIDLGTTYSCVAVFINDKVEVILNDQGNRTTPSRVAFDGSQILVGDAAMNLSARGARGVIYDAKRMIGRRFSEKEVQADRKAWPFDTCEGDNDAINVSVEFNGQTLRLLPEQVSAKLLEYLKKCAEQFLGKAVTKAVITVPAYFSDAQRERTRVAGSIAGLEVLRIINEPTAASLCYGLDSKKPATGAGEAERIVVFDFGGGTLDVSVIVLDNGAFNVLSTAGDTHLGGQDVDQLLVHHVLADAAKRAGGGADLAANPKLLARVRTACEKAKRALSHASSFTIELDGVLGGDDYSFVLSRAKLEELCAPVFKKCIAVVARALADAKLEPGDADEVILVGGSSRIPKMREMLGEYFRGRALNFSVNPDEAIAIGAAIQASILSNAPEQRSEKTAGVVLMDVLPLSIGVDVDDGRFDTIIRRNTTIPYRMSKEYSTTEKNQTEVTIDIYEGERPLVKHNRLVGSFVLDGITKAPAGDPDIVVTFSVDANGILTVTAEEKLPEGKGAKKAKMGGGASRSMVVKNSDRLSAEQVAEMVEVAARLRDADALATQVHDAVTAAHARVREAADALDALGEPHRSAPKSTKLAALCGEALAWIDGKGRKALAVELVQGRLAKIERVAKKALKHAARKAGRSGGDGGGDGEREGESDASSDAGEGADAFGPTPDGGGGGAPAPAATANTKEKKAAAKAPRTKAVAPAAPEAVAGPDDAAGAAVTAKAERRGRKGAHEEASGGAAVAEASAKAPPAKRQRKEKEGKAGKPDAAAAAAAENAAPGPAVVAEGAAVASAAAAAPAEQPLATGAAAGDDGGLELVFGATPEL